MKNDVCFSYVPNENFEILKMKKKRWSTIFPVLPLNDIPGMHGQK